MTGVTFGYLLPTQEAAGGTAQAASRERHWSEAVLTHPPR